MFSWRIVLVLGLGVLLSQCSPTESGPVTDTPGLASTSSPTTSPPAAPVSTQPPTTAATTTLPDPFTRPAWLGTRTLSLRADGHGEAQPTPPELRNRQLETLDLLPPPAGSSFEWSIEAVSEDVLARSTWHPDCPVTVNELAYVQVSHMGFDGDFHTGELIVNAKAAEALVEVFQSLHQSGFPIEQMRVIRSDELDAPPTGDGNDTTSFVCRLAVGSTRWSQHAFGLAVDINPFHNPYLKGDLVLPELASSYTDRTDVRPGMIMPGDMVTEAFAEIGWGWGGNWNSLKDWMHFSQSGR